MGLLDRLGCHRACGMFLCEDKAAGSREILALSSVLPPTDNRACPTHLSVLPSTH